MAAIVNMARVKMADVNRHFFSSVWYSNISEMRRMLLQGADIDFIQDKRSALVFAAEQGEKKVVKFLLENGAKIDLKNHDGESALMRAIFYRNVEVIKLLLEHGAQPNQTNNEGMTALAYACNNFFDETTERKQISIVNLLLKHGAQINFKERGGRSALMLVVRNNYGDGLITNLLLKKGANVNLQDENGLSALIWAARIHDVQFTIQLINYGAKVDLRDIHGQSALLHCAIFGENCEIMEILLKHGAQVNMQNNEGRSALTFARFQSTVQLLLDHGAQVDLQDNDGNSALMHVYSVTSESIECAQALLEGGAQVNLQNKHGWSALMFATQTAILQRVHLLLKHKADVDLQDENGKSSLMIAIEENPNEQVAETLLNSGAQVNLQDGMGRSAIMLLYLDNMVHGHTENLLLDNGADVTLIDLEGKSALMLACQNNAIQDVSKLLSRGAEVNLQDKEGWSALMRAAAGVNKTLKLKQLVEKKAAVNLRNREGRTALMIASWDGNTEAVKILLHGGAAIDSGDNDERSALVHASGREHIEVAQLLLEYGAYLDWQDIEGYTPLMVACLNGCKQMTSFLIDSGASIYLKNNDGKTAYDLALEKNYTDIFELFTKLRTNSSFPGILFSEDVRKKSLTSSAKNIDLEDIGISLSIPEDALPSTDPPLEVQILPCISGSWEVPENLELVSPAYIVEPSREVVFRKEVLVKIWHHANLESEEDCEDMVFLSASTTPEYRDGRPVYMFQEITGVKGSFRPREKLPVGEITLKHFCILGIFRDFFQSHIYSARLYTSRKRKAVIFCMCLSQPQYIKCCDEEMAALYKIQDKARDLLVRDGVTITAEEVCLKQNCPKEWKTLCRNDPASILKNAISIHTRYEPGDCNFPKIEIAITDVPKSRDSEPLELRVEGLNVESVFKLPPGEFMKFEFDTTNIRAAMEELGDEIKGQSSECSGRNNILSIATQMLEHMECIVKLLQAQDPHSVSDSVLRMLRDMDGESRLLRDEAKKTLTSLKVTYDMEAHVEDVSFYSRQLKMIYSANIHHSFGSDHTSEWQAATSIFITNAANLMSSIKDVLKASKSAQSLPNNRLDTTPQPYPLPSASSQTKHSQNLLHTQATPRQHVCREYFGREAPTIGELCIAVNDHPTDTRFNLSNHISDCWKTIGLTLGMELGLLNSIERNRYDDAERLMTVFRRWLENAACLPHHARYPLSWQGLNTLLEDIGKTEVAKQYFEFLDDLQSN